MKAYFLESGIFAAVELLFSFYHRLNYLNWKEVSGKEWTKIDEIALIERCLIMRMP